MKHKKLNKTQEENLNVVVRTLSSSWEPTKGALNVIRLIIHVVAIAYMAICLQDKPTASVLDIFKFARKHQKHLNSLWVDFTKKYLDPKEEKVMGIIYLDKSKVSH